MKKIGKTLLAIAIFVLPFMTYISKVDAKILNYGDVDENGIIDMNDSGLVMQYAMGTVTSLTPIQMILADVNGDCIVNNRDAIAIEQIYMNQVGTSLSSQILGSNNANVISSTPDFSSTSTDNGLYSGTDDDGTTYYYRGNVDYNYVQLGTYKSDVTNYVYDPNSNSSSNQVVAQAGDPILWRIVRVNGDGSIRLIAEHNTELDVPYDSTSPYSSDYKGSNIETEVNNWYNTNIAVDSNIDSLIITENYCNDISDNYNAVKTRMENKTPILTCPSEANVINNKVGLISADEIMYAGALKLQSVVNNTTYLNNNTYFWTISPYSSAGVFLWFPYSNNLYLNGYDVSFDYGIRPVINLKSDVTIIGGSGTETNPYVIGEIDTSTKPKVMNTIEADLNRISKIDLNSKGIYSTFNTSSNNGEWLYSWNLEQLTGDDEINTEEASGIDTRIDIEKDVAGYTEANAEYNQIKYALQGANKEANATYIKLYQTGDLPRSVNIEINKDMYGITGTYLYYWDAENQRFISKGQITETLGSIDSCDSSTQYTKVSLNNIDKGGYYVITETALTATQINSPQTGMGTFYIIGGIIILVGAGIGFLIYSKKTSKFPKI